MSKRCAGVFCLWIGLFLPTIGAGETLLYPLDHAPAVSSTFGTYRIARHHAGLDLVTGGDETVAVLAAASGRVVRIRRNQSGFGRAVYLSHENGRITVYAHLSAFGPELAPLVAAAEAKNKGFKFDYRPRKTLRVRRGDRLGWVGTSGTDLVHLHFELRVNGTPVNPLRNGLELPDSRPPEVRTILAIPYGHRSHVNHGHDEHFVTLGPAKKDTEPVLVVGGRVGLFVEAVDFIDGHDRALTPYSITLRIDGKPWHGVRYDTTSYRDRGHTELDYHLRLKSRGKGMYHRLFGQGVRFAQQRRVGRTLERLRPGRHSAEIEVVDSVGQKTVQRFVIDVQPAKAPCNPPRGRASTKDGVAIQGTPVLRQTTLLVPTDTLCAPDTHLTVRVDGRIQRKVSVSRLGGIPAVAVQVPTEKDAVVTIGLTRGGKTSWRRARTYATPEGKQKTMGPARIEIQEGARFFPYPTLIWTEENPGKPGLSPVGPIHRFANAYTPAKGGMKVSLQQPKGIETKGLGIYLEEAGRWWYAGGVHKAGRVSGRTVHPVGLALMRDLTPPSIGAAEVRGHPGGHRLFIPIHDEGSGLRAVEVSFDGSPIEGEHQRAWKRWIYRPTIPPAPGPHRVSIVLRDRAGLETRRQITVEWPAKK